MTVSIYSTQLCSSVTGFLHWAVLSWTHINLFVGVSDLVPHKRSCSSFTLKVAQTCYFFFLNVCLKSMYKSDCLFISSRRWNGHEEPIRSHRANQTLKKKKKKSSLCSFRKCPLWVDFVHLQTIYLHTWFVRSHVKTGIVIFFPVVHPRLSSLPLPPQCYEDEIYL